MSPIVFEINEDTIYKDKCCGESYAMFFLVILKKKCRASTHLHTHIYAHCLYNSYVIGYVIHRIDKSTWSCIEFYSGVLTLEMMVFITCVMHVLLAQSRLPPSKGSVFAHGHEKRAQGQEGRPLTCRVLQRD